MKSDVTVSLNGGSVFIEFHGDFMKLEGNDREWFCRLADLVQERRNPVASAPEPSHADDRGGTRVAVETEQNDETQSSDPGV